MPDSDRLKPPRCPTASITQESPSRSTISLRTETPLLRSVMVVSHSLLPSACSFAVRPLRAMAFPVRRYSSVRPSPVHSSPSAYLRWYRFLQVDIRPPPSPHRLTFVGRSVSSHLFPLPRPVRLVGVGASSFFVLGLSFPFSSRQLLWHSCLPRSMRQPPAFHPTPPGVPL